MKKALAKKYLNIIYPMLSLVVFFLIWFIVAKVVDLEVILPSPSASFASLGEIIIGSKFWLALGNTLQRTLISFVFSLISAIVLAALSALFKPVYHLLSPIVIITRAVPTMSIILLSLIWFTAKITPMFIAFLIVFPMLYAAFYSAFTNIDKGFVEMSKLYKVSKWQMVSKFYVPYISPTFFDSIRSAISLNVKLIIAAEVLAQTRDSMGVMMQISSLYLDTSSLIAWTIAAIIISYFLEMIVIATKRLFVRWK